MANARKGRICLIRRPPLSDCSKPGLQSGIPKHSGTVGPVFRKLQLPPFESRPGLMYQQGESHVPPTTAGGPVWLSGALYGSQE